MSLLTLRLCTALTSKRSLTTDASAPGESMEYTLEELFRWNLLLECMASRL